MFFDITASSDVLFCVSDMPRAVCNITRAADSARLIKFLDEQIWTLVSLIFLFNFSRLLAALIFNSQAPCGRLTKVFQKGVLISNGLDDMKF